MFECMTCTHMQCVDDACVCMRAQCGRVRLRERYVRYLEECAMHEVFPAACDRFFVLVLSL